MRTIPAPLATEALDSPDLVMPGDDLPPGPTRELRRAMARFQDGRDHTAARSLVVSAIAAVDASFVAEISARRTRSLIEADRTDLVSALVPAATMAETFGVLDEHDDGQRLVDLLVRVGDPIVAGTMPTTPAGTDEATSDLWALVEPHGDPVALISILHQTRGATGALIDTLRHAHEPRPAAVPATKRTASRATEVGSFGSIEAGETVAVALDLSTEFGHGRHECPGRALAETIAAAVSSTLADG